jgi:hypothetical protein
MKYSYLIKKNNNLPTGPAWTNNSHSSSSETYEIRENYSALVPACNDTEEQ